jgi:hypothetical protein
LSIAAGASSETSVPKNELMSRLKLMSPSAIVTGSISFRTWITYGLRQSKLSVKRPPVPRSQGSGRMSWTTVPASTPMA